MPLLCSNKAFKKLINKLRNECLMGDRYLPMGDVRRYNQLVYELYGDELGEDPEILEAKATLVETNADRVRAMTDEELAKFLTKKMYARIAGDWKSWLKWLREEAEE